MFCFAVISLLCYFNFVVCSTKPHAPESVCFCILYFYGGNHMSKSHLLHSQPSVNMQETKGRHSSGFSKQWNGNVFPRNICALCIFYINEFASFSFGWETISSIPYKRESLNVFWTKFILSLQTNNHFQLPLKCKCWVHVSAENYMQF